MCIQFVEKSGSYDFISPIINCTGNAMIIAAAGISSGVIIAVALKALGYGKAAAAIGSAIPLIVGGAGMAAAAVGVACLAAIAYAFVSALSRR